MFKSIFASRRAGPQPESPTQAADSPTTPPMSEAEKFPYLYHKATTATSHRASCYGPFITSSWPSLASPPAIERRRPAIHIVDPDVNNKESPVEVGHTSTYPFTVDHPPLPAAAAPSGLLETVAQESAEVLEPARPESTILPVSTLEEQVEPPWPQIAEEVPLERLASPINLSKPTVPSPPSFADAATATSWVPLATAEGPSRSRRPTLLRGLSHTSALSMSSCSSAMSGVRETPVEQSQSGKSKARDRLSHLRRASSDVLSLGGSRGHQREESATGYTISQASLGTYIQHLDDPELDLPHSLATAIRARERAPSVQVTQPVPPESALQRLQSKARRQQRPWTAPGATGTQGALGASIASVASGGSGASGAVRALSSAGPVPGVQASPGVKAASGGHVTPTRMPRSISISRPRAGTGRPSAIGKPWTTENEPVEELATAGSDPQRVFSVRRNPSLVDLVRGVVSPKSAASPVSYRPGYEPVAHQRESSAEAQAPIHPPSGSGASGGLDALTGGVSREEFRITTRAGEDVTDIFVPGLAKMQARHARDEADSKSPLGRLRVRARRLGRKLGVGDKDPF